MSAVDDVANLWIAGCRISSLGRGHIHDTYLLEGTPDEAKLVLQKVNGQVFSDPEKLMGQTARVLLHLKQGGQFKVPQLVESRNGGFLEFFEGFHWRAWTFIEDSRTVDPIEKIEQAENAAEAFGLFQRAMETFESSALEEPIPGYQNLSYHLDAFEEVKDQSPSELLEIVQGNRWLVERFQNANSVVHGDCKTNNVLFNQKNDKVKAIIDLDTVMPGHWSIDFGDFVRSLWFGSQRIDPELFRVSIRGFLRGAPRRDYLPEEFVEAPLYISLMLGVRFLTDHLQGDRYFKVSARGDNLVRAQEQFLLYQDCFSSRESLLAVSRQMLEISE